MILARAMKVQSGFAQYEEMMNDGCAISYNACSKELDLAFKFLREQP